MQREVAQQTLLYIKMNIKSFEQLQLLQANEAITMLANNISNTGSDPYFMPTLEKLTSYVNIHKSKKSAEPDFLSDNNLFWGRDKENASVIRFMDGGNSVLFIHGLRGIGKTKLTNNISTHVLPPSSPWNIKKLEFDTGIGYDLLLDKLTYSFNMSYIERKGKSPEYLADKFFEQMERQSATLIIMDDFHNCVNVDGSFSDERVKEFIIKFVLNIVKSSKLKLILTSNRRIKKLQNLDIVSIEMTKLDNNSVESIISYCYRSLTKNHRAPAISDSTIELAYGNPLAAILIAQLISENKIEEFEGRGDVFHRYQEGLIKRLIEGVTLTEQEEELMNILAVSKGDLYSEFIEKYFPQLVSTIDALINRLFIEKNSGKLSIHQLFREYFYDKINVKNRTDLHAKYAEFFEHEYEDKEREKDPTILSNVIYHLGGSLQKSKLEMYKGRYIDEVKPIADQLYRDKNFKDAISYYMLIYNAIGSLRHDVLIRMCICYVQEKDIKNAEKFFELATASNPRGAYLWAQYSIALSNGRRFLTEAIKRAEQADEVCNLQGNNIPWELAKIKFAFAKAYQYNNIGKSLSYFKEACDLESTNVYYLCMYAKTLIESNDLSGAISEINKADKIEPKYDFLIRLKDEVQRKQTKNYGDGDLQHNETPFNDDDYVD